MNNELTEILVTVITYSVPIIFSIPFHEMAHGWMAYRLGDPTAKNLGRLTLNPIPHIDLMGTIILPILMIVIRGPVFGWAKPVPFNPHNFDRHIDIRKGTMWVALAGPTSNLLLAFIFSFIYVLTIKFTHSSFAFIFEPFSLIAQAFIAVNLILAILNLIPIPPLDGSKIVMGFLPARYYNAYVGIEHYGMIIIMILLVTRTLSYLVVGPYNFLYRLFLWIPRFLFGAL